MTPAEHLRALRAPITKPARKGMEFPYNQVESCQVHTRLVLRALAHANSENAQLPQRLAQQLPPPIL